MVFGQRTFALEVEFYGVSHCISGTVRMPSESYRLTDLLNNADEAVHVVDASVARLHGSDTEKVHDLMIEKEAILLAIPRETEDFLSRQRLTRTGMARPDQKPVQAFILLPPYVVKGLIFALSVGENGRIERGRLQRFAAVSGSQVFRDGEPLFESGFLTVNRDAVHAIGRLSAGVDAAAASGFSTVPPTPPLPPAGYPAA